MAIERAQLVKMSQAELDDVFRKSAAGDIPNGEGIGTAVVLPGTLCGKLIAWFARWFCWQGKVFHASEGWLVNRISAFSCRAIRARVYKDKSWLDQKECIVLDYSKTSLFARKIRDEIRLVDETNKIYLGKVWWGQTRLVDFALQFPK